jgi:predicted kinase
MATRLGVRVHRSDVARKRLFGMAPHEPATAEFGEGIYTTVATARTYEVLLQEVREELRRGNSTMADATFGRREYRDHVRQIARELGVNLLFVECISPERILRRRLADRREGGLITNARLHHFEAQRRAFEAMDEIPESMHIRVRTDAALEQSLLVVFSETYLRQIWQARHARRAERTAASRQRGL